MTKPVYFELPEWRDEPREVIPIPGLGTPARSNDEWPYWLEKVAKHIRQVNQEMRESWTGRASALARELQRIRQDGRYWVNVHAGIYEARVDEEDDRVKSLLTPFILYPFQDYAWGWLDERSKSRGRMGDGLILKSRDMGMTNLVCARFTHKWLTTQPYQARLLSRKEDLVDDKFQPDSMMWKIEYFIKSTYKPLFENLVPGFIWRSHRNDNKIANPNNSNLISGESTNATAGRGGRCTEMALDEFTFMRNPKGIWTATRASTRHRYAIFTPSVSEGTFVHDLVEPSIEFPDHKKPAILRVVNSLHPYHDASWLAREQERDSEEGIRQEIFLDWFADTSDYVYPDMSRMTVGDYPYLPFQGTLFCALDDGMDNDWATLWLQLVHETGRIRVVEAHKKRNQIADFYGSVYTGIFDSRFHYDAEDRRVMEWTRTIETPIYIGDAHGRDVNVTSGLSVIDVLAQNWNIWVNTDPNPYKRLYTDRIQAVGAIMDRLDWNDTPGVRVALSDIQRHKWKRTREGAELTSEYRQPGHGSGSHSATALEWFAMQFPIYAGTMTGGSGFMYYQDEFERYSGNPDQDAEYGEQGRRLTYADIR